MNNEKNWTGVFIMILKGDDLFYTSPEDLKKELNEFYDGQEIKIIDVKQIGDIIKK